MTLSSRTKQINVYGKRNRRIIDAPSTENSIYDVAESTKSNRVPLIQRMKKRENATQGSIKAKPTSPPRAVSLTKQRVMPNGSPTRKGIKRGMRVAEILAQETTKFKSSKGEEGISKQSVLGTPSRMPLSTVTTNAAKSPAIVVLKVPKKHTATSPKSLVTSKALSTVQMDIKVLDAKGQMLKQEKRLKRTDVVVNKAPLELDIPLVPTRKKQPSAPKRVPPPTEVISIGSSVNEPLQSNSQDPGGTLSQPIVLSSGSSTAADSDYKLRPVRQQRRAITRVIVSDEEDEEDEDENYLPPDSQPLRESLTPPRKSAASIPKLTAISKSSRLKVEVVIPPALYKLQSKPVEAPLLESSPELSPPPRVTFQRCIPAPHTQPSLSPGPKAKHLRTSTSESGQLQGPIPSRYPTTSYDLIPSPPFKSRQLTPVRHGQGKGTLNTSGLFAYGRGVPTSPATPTDSDFDLSLEFSQLDIGLAPDELEALQLRGKQYPEYLRPLLEECLQEETGPYEFSAFIKSFPLDPILQDARRAAKRRNDGEMLRFRKIGEASYSEVFGIGDVVLKVIPLRDELRYADEGDEYEEDGPAPTDAKDVWKEIIVTRAMGDVHDGFVKLLKTYVVRGKYPDVFLNLWDEYHERKCSESVRPDTFTVSQMYAIIVLPNGGPDLEAYAFTNSTKTGWRQACSLFWQVAKSLAHAEQLVSFEHRDLHWGQILVKDLPVSSKSAPLRSLTHTLNQSRSKPPASSQKLYMDDASHGVRATIIDLGLSRMDAGDGDSGYVVHWTPFDDEVFMGEGDYQFDVYRLMREHTSGDWEAFNPLTNVMWLHYLLTKLLRHKNLKAPSAPRKPRTVGNAPEHTQPSLNTLSAGPFTEKDCYDSLVDIEDWLGRYISEIIPIPAVQRGKARSRPRKTVMSSQIKGVSSTPPCACAGEVVGYGVKRGWIRPVDS